MWWRELWIRKVQIGHGTFQGDKGKVWFRCVRGVGVALETDNGAESLWCYMAICKGHNMRSCVANQRNVTLCYTALHLTTAHCYTNRGNENMPAGYLDLAHSIEAAALLTKQGLPSFTQRPASARLPWPGFYCTVLRSTLSSCIALIVLHCNRSH